MTAEYVLTYVSEAGKSPLSLTVALGNEQQARQFASRTAQRCHAVTLESVDDDGAVAAMARWLDGALTRNPNGNSALIIDADEDDEAEVETEDDEEIADVVSGDELENADEEDEAHHFEGQCMKCKVKREFIGRVKELSNGSRQARGHCPVCGTSIVRMVSRSTPLDDDWDDDTSPGVADEGYEAEGTVTFPAVEMDVESEPAEIETEISEAIAEATEGAPIAEVAEATTELAAEFSHAAAEVEEAPKPAPRKRAAKKATGNSDGRTPNQKAAANPTKGHCPKCDQNVDVIERAGIRIFTLHPDEAKGLDKCPGSTTVVQGG